MMREWKYSLRVCVSLPRLSRIYGISGGKAAIEDEYARRLLRLSKQTLGQGEVAELKNSLDVIRQETERQAGQHLTLSVSIKKELEGPVAEFAIEKTFKQKQVNETYVAKAKERYEQDCHRVNSYTAQQGLVQGKELEKIGLKLERAQGTIESNKRDYQNFTRALADTVARWDKEWKTYCDQCQDLEEERLEFMKDNIWAYANASCEAIRLALERLDVEKDIEYFVSNHGTGSAIPEPPPFINYSSAEPTPIKPASRPANFARATNRPQSYMSKLAPAPNVAEDEPSDPGTAGIGAGHSRSGSRSHMGANDTGISLVQQPSSLPFNAGQHAPTLPP
ncbi:4955_t:CDS:2, partial [Acaulospora colombiana]